MPLEGPSLQNGATDWLWAGALAFLGRMLVLANRPIRPSGWALVVSLLWELPVAGAFAVIGEAAAEYFHLSGRLHDAAILGLAYGGTRTLSFFLARALSARAPTP